MALVRWTALWEEDPAETFNSRMEVQSHLDPTSSYADWFLNWARWGPKRQWQVEEGDAKVPRDHKLEWRRLLILPQELLHRSQQLLRAVGGG